MSDETRGASGGGKRQHREFVDSAWTKSGVSSLERLKHARSFAERALRKAVNAVLEPYNRENTRTLEVGSGMGYLRSLLSGWKGAWTQVEPAEELLRKAIAGKGEAKDDFVVASAYALPFKDESHDLVVGMASYDVMIHLDEAVAETLRVLKPGGHFVHLFDFRAPADPVIALLEEAGMEKGKDFTYTEAQDDQTPSSLFVKTTNEAHKAVLELLVFEKGAKKGMRKVDMNPTFEGLLLRSLKKHGFNIISAGKQTASFTGPPVGLQRNVPGLMNITLEAGAVDAMVDDDKAAAPPALPGLPRAASMVEERAVLDVIIAEKPRA